jgi:para-nitrobenzyl esterase
MVWIYGGWFTIGGNIQYDPSRIAERQGVLVVAANYRLGAFGLLAHPGLRGAGEGANALLDQQAALRWVRDNIAAFGGDPHDVTLFGESAGGMSICFQMTSPGAVGLFQHAILESGVCIAPNWRISMAAAEAGGLTFASTLGCGDPAKAADCLRQLPAAALLKAKPGRPGLLAA